VIRKLLALCFLISMVLSCANESNSAKKRLSPGKMKLVLYDLLLAESYVQTDTAMRSEAAAIRNQVFKNHGLTEKQFQESLSFYQKEPELYKQLADSLSAYSTTQTADKLKVQIKLNLDGHHIEDSAGSIRDLKGNR